MAERESEPDFDVIVVGAGPGGSNAAAAALKRGLTVAQIDRQPFPRIKPCGGGITIKSSRALIHDMAPMMRGESQEVQFNVFDKRLNNFTHRTAAVLRMVDRPQFDSWMVAQNQQQKRFQFFDGEPVLEVHYDGVFTIRTQNLKLKARHLVGADGAYSFVNRQFKVTRPRGNAVAVEVILRRDRATLDAETPPCFDFGAVESGYGWVFPKDDHWNVGLYTLAKTKTLRRDLSEYIAKKGFRVQGDALETFEGHQFPYGGYAVTIPKAPVYIVGDAGGFGDPIMGEGIYHALESGRIAGETIGDCIAGKATHADYYRRIRRTVLSDTFVTYHIAKEFYRNVAKGVTILENPLVWRPLVQGYSEGATFTSILKKGGWLLTKSYLRDSLRYDRLGVNERFSLAGPFRGGLFLLEPFYKRLTRWSRVSR